VVANLSATTASTPPIAPKQELLYTEIESLMKAFKGGHRCALDFDRGLVNSELKEAKASDGGVCRLFFMKTYVEAV
jgi:hypothetical protein